MMSDSEELKAKFKRLMQEMSELVKSTPKEELEKIKLEVLKTNRINPVAPSAPSVVCKTEEEFLLRMSERITGVPGKRAYILQHPDSLSEKEIAEHKARAIKQNRMFILPSLIFPISNHDPERYFEPYIAFFTHDKKIFVYPYEGEFFSDLEFESDDSIVKE